MYAQRANGLKPMLSNKEHHDPSKPPRFENSVFDMKYSNTKALKNRDKSPIPDVEKGMIQNRNDHQIAQFPEGFEHAHPNTLKMRELHP